MSGKRRLHFAGIGSPVMFDLAIAMKKAGHEVSGSEPGPVDPGITERLSENGLLPNGRWHPELIADASSTLIISPDIKEDNPELQQARKLKANVLSYPEFIELQCRNKHRVVLAGSPGKITIALLIIHTLRYHKRDVDYVLSRPVPGMDDSVRLTNAPLVIIDSLEGPASALDPTTTFLKYKHHIGIISGIEWFGSHGYSSKEDYAKQFSAFEKATPKGGVLIYFDLEPVVGIISKEPLPDVLYIPYKTHPSQSDGGVEYLVESAAERHPVKLSGKHNMQNLSAARETLKKLGVTTPMFFEAIRNFGV